MDKLTLAASSREQRGKQVKKLRLAGQLPAVVYGRGVEPEAVSLDAHQTEKIYQRAGGNKIIELKIGDKAAKNVLIHDVQTDSRTGELTHADFYVVKMDEAIQTEVPLHFVGESTAVYQDEGTLLKNLETILVEALPAKLPESIEVDISILDDFEKTIHVSDLTIPADVEVLTDAEELVAKVDPPRSEEELAQLEEAPEEVLPEGVEEEGAEGEAAEGETPAEGESEDKPAA